MRSYLSVLVASLWSLLATANASLLFAASPTQLEPCTVSPVGIPPASDSSGLFRVNYRALVSRADLDYREPARRSEEGMPVGNGRMGSLVWTSPTQLRFQINHANVYGINCETDSFPARHSDYATSCGYLDINLIDYGDEVFAGDDFHQHLSLYDGLMTAEGRGVTVRVLAWPRRDVMAIEIDDRRELPCPISIDLRMLRYAIQYHERQNWELTKNHEVMVRTASHTATSGLEICDDRIALAQKFREDEFYGASSVVAAVVGRDHQPRYQNDSTVRLVAAPGKGKFTILIAAAATFDPTEDVVATANAELDAAAAQSFDELRAETAESWHSFWSRGFVHLYSDDGQADFLEQQYTYFLYLMAASSRGGDYPPRFGGMLWYTNGDLRAWGSQHWWANTSAYYSNLMPSGRLELMDPMFAMYSGMRDSCARAARQQWGSQGVWIPETVWFDGLEDLSETIAAEMRDLYLLRKPWSEASEEFLRWASTKQPHASRVNWKDKGHWDQGKWIYADKGSGPFGHTTHILGAGARIAELYWQRYQYTLDERWLRERAYPLIRGAAEFYRNFPNFHKDDDGLYHVMHVNNSESDWNTNDTPYEIYSMNLVFPLAVRAAEILKVDPDLRPVWEEIAEHLPPSTPRRRRGFGAFVYGGPGEIEPMGEEKELKRRFLSFTGLGSFIDDSGIGGAEIFRNRLRLREGPGAIDAEHIAGLSGGIQTSLLDSTPPSPAADPVLRLCQSWPRDWNAEFRLLARGGFVVTAAVRGGKISMVEIDSQAGETCRLANPWPDERVTVWIEGEPTETLTGELLTIPTETGQSFVLTPQGRKPTQIVVADADEK